MSSIPIDKQYHGFGDILLLDVLHKITQDFQIDVTIDITFRGDGTAPPARDSCVRYVTNVLVSVPRPSAKRTPTYSPSAETVTEEVMCFLLSPPVLYTGPSHPFSVRTRWCSTPGLRGVSSWLLYYYISNSQ